MLINNWWFNCSYTESDLPLWCLIVIFGFQVNDMPPSAKQTQNNRKTMARVPQSWASPVTDRHSYTEPNNESVLPSFASVVRSIGIPHVFGESVHSPPSAPYTAYPLYSHHEVSVSHSPPEYAVVSDPTPLPSVTFRSLTPTEPNMSQTPKKKTVKPRKSNKSARVLPGEASAILLDWFAKNKSNPYPTNEEKEYFLKTTGLTRKQIKDWFVNHRQRSLIKDKVKKPTKTSSKTFLYTLS
jgi:hypothetical protein